MIPRLLFVYGPAPHPTGDWLQVPTRKLRMYVDALPQLEARSTLTRIQAMSVAFGGGEEQERAGYLNSLERTANGGRQFAQKPTVKPVAEGQVIHIGGDMRIPVETIGGDT